jgi:hypothetical protein
MNITIRDINLNQQDRANKQAQAEQARIIQQAQERPSSNTRSVIRVLSQIIIK